MRLGIWVDNERSDDRLKYKEDQRATGSWRGQGKNTQLHFTQSHILVLRCFSISSNLVETSALARGS